MAGLLDIFGTSGQETMGLLGMSPEEVQRNRDSAQAQALYALAGRLFQGGRGASSVLEGLQQGQQAYRTAMQGSLQQQLQNAQIQELKKKRELEQQALMRQQGVENLITQAYRPETFADTPLTNMMGQEIAGPNMPQAAGIGMDALAPKLMATKEGRAALKDLQPEYKEVNGALYEITLGAPPRLVAGNKKRDTVTVGNQVLDKNSMELLYTAPETPKVAKLTGKEANAALMFFGTDDVAKLREIPNAIDKIRVEATTQRKAEQPQINLNDPTAVQTQLLKTLNQWEGALKDSGAAETAMRAQGFYAAYEQALKGNANADGALIYNVAKVYDPAGAVQAGDVSTVIGVPSMPETIKKAAQKLTTGGSLTPKERENMKKIIDAVVDERSRMIAPSLNTYRKINRGLGGTDDLIVNPYDMVKKPRSLEEILGIGRPRGGQ
jgi:hypothetical protein